MPFVPIDIERIEDLAAAGLTLAEMSAALGVGERTLYRRKKHVAALADAIKRGQARGAETVSNALFQRALAGDTTAIIWYEKTRRGLSDRPTATALRRQVASEIIQALQPRLAPGVWRDVAGVIIDYLNH